MVGAATNGTSTSVTSIASSSAPAVAETRQQRGQLAILPARVVHKATCRSSGPAARRTSVGSGAGHDDDVREPGRLRERMMRAGSVGAVRRCVSAALGRPIRDEAPAARMTARTTLTSSHTGCSARLRACGKRTRLRATVYLTSRESPAYTGPFSGLRRSSATPARRPHYADTHP